MHLALWVATGREGAKISRSGRVAEGGSPLSFHECCVSGSGPLTVGPSHTSSQKGASVIKDFSTSTPREAALRALAGRLDELQPSKIRAAVAQLSLLPIGQAALVCPVGATSLALPGACWLVRKCEGEDP
jgi:hypothetical protein